MTAPLHVLRVADVPRSAEAGVSGFMLTTGAELEHAGHRVEYWFRPQLVPKLAGDGLRRMLVPWLLVLRMLLRSTRPDVVEIHEPLAGPYAAAARWLRRLGLPPCVVLSHGLEERGWAAKREYLRHHGSDVSVSLRLLVPLLLLSQARVGIRNAAAVVVVSGIDRQYLVDALGVAPDRAFMAWQTAAGGVAEPAPRQPRKPVRVLFVGSWIERKGVLELAEAWRVVAAERPSARLTVAGCGDAVEAVRTALSGTPFDALPLVERQDLPGLLAEHEVFVLPSFFEGLPLALLEAAAAGLACVVTGVCGNVDVIRPDAPERDGGIVIPPHDSAALAEAIARLVEDPALRATLGDRARERASAFSWESTAAEIARAYAVAVG